MTRGIALPDDSMALTRNVWPPRHRVSLSAETRSFGRWIDRTIKVSVLALDPYIGLVYPVGLVGGPKMRPAALMEFRCIRLNPPPNAAGIHRKAALGQHLSHMLVRQRIS